MLCRGANVTLGNGTLTIFDQTSHAVADGGRACRTSQVLCGYGGTGRAGNFGEIRLAMFHNLLGWCGVLTSALLHVHVR